MRTENKNDQGPDGVNSEFVEFNWNFNEPATVRDVSILTDLNEIVMRFSTTFVAFQFHDVGTDSHCIITNGHFGFYRT